MTEEAADEHPRGARSDQAIDDLREQTVESLERATTRARPGQSVLIPSARPVR